MLDIILSQNLKYLQSLLFIKFPIKLQNKLQFKI